MGRWRPWRRKATRSASRCARMSCRDDGRWVHGRRVRQAFAHASVVAARSPCWVGGRACRGGGGLQLHVNSTKYGWMGPLPARLCCVGSYAELPKGYMLHRSKTVAGTPSANQQLLCFRCCALCGRTASSRSGIYRSPGLQQHGTRSLSSRLCKPSSSLSLCYCEAAGGHALPLATLSWMTPFFPAVSHPSGSAEAAAASASTSTPTMMALLHVRSAATLVGQ